MGSPTPARLPLDAAGLTWMMTLCVIWCGNYVVAKLAAPDMSLVLQGSARAGIAMLLLLVWARYRAIPLFNRDASLWPGLLAGAMFAAEFLCIYAGLTYTGAARMAVFVYLAPCFTALGIQWLMPSERLNGSQWIGIALAFVGVAVAFADGFVAQRASLLGDVLGVLAGALWGLTTVVVRVTTLSRIPATKALFYQLGLCTLTLWPASVLLGESGIRAFTPMVLFSMFYQGVLIAFITYLVWLWLLTRYLSAQLAAFTFVTPILSVAAGAVFLHETIRASFVAAVALVALGLYLVNRPQSRTIPEK